MSRVPTVVLVVVMVVVVAGGSGFVVWAAVSQFTGRVTCEQAAPDTGCGWGR